jgi:hypothetical protein
MNPNRERETAVSETNTACTYEQVIEIIRQRILSSEKPARHVIDLYGLYSDPNVSIQEYIKTMIMDMYKLQLPKPILFIIDSTWAKNLSIRTISATQIRIELPRLIQGMDNSYPIITTSRKFVKIRSKYKRFNNNSKKTTTTANMSEEDENYIKQIKELTKSAFLVFIDIIRGFGSIQGKSQRGFKSIRDSVMEYGYVAINFHPDRIPIYEHVFSGPRAGTWECYRIISSTANDITDALLSLPNPPPPPPHHHQNQENHTSSLETCSEYQPRDSLLLPPAESRLQATVVASTSNTSASSSMAYSSMNDVPHSPTHSNTSSPLYVDESRPFYNPRYLSAPNGRVPTSLDHIRTIMDNNREVISTNIGQLFDMIEYLMGEYEALRDLYVKQQEKYELLEAAIEKFDLRSKKRKIHML